MFHVLTTTVTSQLTSDGGNTKISDLNTILNMDAFVPNLKLFFFPVAKTGLKLGLSV